jgi:peptidoglycan-N-acetylglucosamine deacetylase
MNAPTNMVTIDVEDWYHICGIEDIIPHTSWDHCESRVKKNIEKILYALQARNIRATFFILGYISERHPDLVKMIDREGHEIASHGYNHLHTYSQSPEDFHADLHKSKYVIESIIGRHMSGYRAPEWSLGKRRSAAYKALSVRALGTLQEIGFKYDSSIAPLRIIGAHKAPVTPYVIRTPHGDLIELPPFVMKTFMGNIPIGGGWGLRIVSARDISNTIKHFNKANKPVVIHLHPWEIDDELPRLKLPLAKRFVCYAAIQNAWPKFLRLLDEFHFASIEEALLTLDYKSLPVYEAGEIEDHLGI